MSRWVSSAKIKCGEENVSWCIVASIYRRLPTQKKKKKKRKRKKWVTGISFCRLPKIWETPRLGSRMIISRRSGASTAACWGTAAVLWRCYYSGLTPVDLSYINAPVFTVKSECTLTRGLSIRPAISCYETCKEHSTGESKKKKKNTAKMSAWNTDTFLLFFFFFSFWIILFPPFVFICVCFFLIRIRESAGDWDLTYTVTVPPFLLRGKEICFLPRAVNGSFFISLACAWVRSDLTPVSETRTIYND